MPLIDTLIMPFQFEFMVRALIISTIVSVPMALLSCFLVLKGWSLMGDAISHAVFPGIVIAYILGFPYAIGAFAAGMTCALATGYLSENSRIKQDTVMGIVFAGMFGLGLVMYVKIQSSVHLDHILFGDMLGVSWGDIVETTMISTLVAAALGLKWKDFLLHAFDPVQARAVGLRVNLLHYGLLCMISLTVVAALKAIGIILAISLMIAPGAIAFLLTQRFSAMLILSVVIAIASSFIGIYLSFFIDSSPAPTIVLLLAAAFIAAFILATHKTARAESRHAASD